MSSLKFPLLGQASGTFLKFVEVTGRSTIRVTDGQESYELEVKLELVNKNGPQPTLYVGSKHWKNGRRHGYQVLARDFANWLSVVARNDLALGLIAPNEGFRAFIAGHRYKSVIQLPAMVAA